MNRITKYISLLILILASSFAFVAIVNAQTPTNYDVTVSPVFFDLSTNPGDTTTQRVRIRNNTSSPLPIKLQLKKLTGDENGELTLKDTSTDDSLSFIKFDKGNTFVANPLEWTDVNFTITVPKTAAYGYYYAISFTQDNSSPLARTGAKITGAAAVPVLLNVRKEGAKADAKIINFSTKQSVYEYLPVNFDLKIQNLGNVHVRPHGNIFISDIGNKDLAVLDVNVGQGNIIPNTTRTFTASWSDGFIVKEPVLEDGQPKLDKEGKAVEKLTINWNRLTSFRVGRYTANVIMVFDNGTRDVSLEGTVSFWVIPYKAIIVIIISLIILILLVRFLLRYYIRKQVRKGLGSRS